MSTLFFCIMCKGAGKDVGKMLGGEEEEKDPEAEKEKEEERQEALKQQEDERKDKYNKMEAEREKVRQGIRDKVTNTPFPQPAIHRNGCAVMLYIPISRQSIPCNGTSCLMITESPVQLALWAV